MASPKRRTAALFALAATADAHLSLSPREAFVQSFPCRPRPFATRLGMVPLDESASGGTGEDDLEGVEAERSRLEGIMSGTGGDGSSKSSGVDNDLRGADWAEQLAAGPPPLTAIGTERVKTEVALLQSLADGDGAVERLWELWYHERGPGPAAELAATDMIIARGTGSFAVAEDMLRQLIKREGIYWTEAVNRLATLLFLQGRYKESKEACEVVLRVKPWHFGALSGIVMVCQGLGDTEGVIGWAGQRMPPLQAELSPVMGIGVVRETRSEWVERVVEEAQKRLLRRAEKGVQESYGMGDNTEGAILGKEEDGTWQ